MYKHILWTYVYTYTYNTYSLIYAHIFLHVHTTYIHKHTLMISVDPKMIKLHTRRGRALLRLGHFTQADESFSRVLETAVNCVGMYVYVYVYVIKFIVIAFLYWLCSHLVWCRYVFTSITCYIHFEFASLDFAPFFDVLFFSSFFIFIPSPTLSFLHPLSALYDHTTTQNTTTHHTRHRVSEDRCKERLEESLGSQVSHEETGAAGEHRYGWVDMGVWVGEWVGESM